MIGRAGRSYKDKYARSIIMTEKDKKNLYEDISDKEFVIRSHFLKSVLDDINNEIALDTINDIHAAEQFIKSSFYYSKELQNEDNDLVDLGIELLVENTFDQLIKLNLLKKVTNCYYSGIISKELAKQCIPIDAVRQLLLMKQKDIKFQEETILKLISESVVFHSINSKLKDRKDLNLLNKEIEYKLKKSASNGSRKVFVLIQAYCQRIPIKNWDLKNEMKDIRLIAIRLLKCIFIIFLKKMKSNEAIISLKWLLQISRQTSKCCPESVFMQIYGVNKQISNAFIEQGIRNISELNKKNIDYNLLLQNNIIKGSIINKLKKSLNCIPQFTFTSSLKTNDNKLAININVETNICCNHYYHNKMILLISNNYDKIIFYRFINLKKSFKEVLDIDITKDDLPVNIYFGSYFYSEYEFNYNLCEIGDKNITTKTNSNLNIKQPRLSHIVSKSPNKTFFRF